MKKRKYGIKELRKLGLTFDDGEYTQLSVDDINNLIENLTKHNNDLSKDCSTCKFRHKCDIQQDSRDGCKYWKSNP